MGLGRLSSDTHPRVAFHPGDNADHFQCPSLTVFQLPSYSPDYKLIEKLWKWVRQTILHRHR
ncbi:MAG TPA: transposase, partial [Anaerolineae bacterium]|nr:transposase [Anaerolineae bacterium]